MAFLFIKNTNVLSVTFLPFSECIWRNPLLHEYTSVNAVALLCRGHPILSCRECSWPMYEAELQTLGVSSVKVLGGTWGALPAAHHHVIWARSEVSTHLFCSAFSIFLYPLSACGFPTNRMSADKLWDGLWLGTPLTSQNLIITSVRGFCDTDMTFVPRICHMKSPMRAWESRKLKCVIMARAKATQGDHAGGHLRSQSGSVTNFQYNLGESLNLSFRLIISKIRKCF